MLDFFKSIPSKITSWYDKKKEEEKQELGQFKYLGKPETNNSFVVNQEKRMSVFNPQTKEIETPISKIDRTIIDPKGQEKSLGSKFVSLFPKINEHVQDVASRTSATMADQLGMQNLFDFAASRAGGKLDDMPRISNAKMFTPDKEKGMSVFNPLSMKETIPQIENKFLNGAARVFAEIAAFYTFSKFTGGLLKAAFPNAVRLAPQVSGVVSSVSARGLSHQMKLEATSTIEDRAKSFLVNLPKDITFSVALTPSIGWKTAGAALFTGSYTSNKLQGMDNKTAATNAGLETAIGLALKFVFKPPSFASMQKKIITQELNLKPNASKEEILTAMNKQIGEKIFYKGDPASPMYPSPEKIQVGRIFVADPNTGEIKIAPQYIQNFSPKDMEMLDSWQKLYNILYANSPEVRAMYWNSYKKTYFDEIKDVARFIKETNQFPRLGKPGFASLGGVPEQQDIYEGLKKAQQEAKSALVAEILNRNPATWTPQERAMIPPEILAQAITPYINQAKELFQKIDQGNIKEAAKLDIAKDLTKEEFVELMVKNDIERMPGYKEMTPEAQQAKLEEDIEQYSKGWGEQFDRLQKSLPKEKPVKAQVETTPLEVKTTPKKAVPQDLMEEARKYKSAEEFVKAKTRNFGLPSRDVADEVYSQIYKDEKPIMMEISKLYPTETSGTKELLGVKDTFGDIKYGRKIENPIIVTEKGTILDGHNRYYQAIANGDKTIPVFIDKPSSITRSQLTDIWNKAQEKPVATTETKPAQTTIQGKVTGIQEQPTKVTKKAIKETIKPLSQKITKGVDYLNKLVLRKGKEAVSTFDKMRKDMFRDLRNLGFTNKEIGRHFSTLLRAKTPEQAEAVKGEVIKKLLETQNKIAKMKLIDSIKSVHKSIKKAKLGQKAEEIFKEINLYPKVKSEKSLAETKEKIMIQLQNQSVWTGEPIKPEDLDFLDKMKSLNELNLRELADLRDSLKGLSASIDYSENITIEGRKFSREELYKQVSAVLDFSKKIYGEEKRLSELTLKDKIIGTIKKPFNWITDLNKNNLSYVSTIFDAPDKEDIVQYVTEMFINANPDKAVVGKYLASYILDGAFGEAENKAIARKLEMLDFFNRLKLAPADSYMSSNKPVITKYKLESGKILPLTNTQKVEIAYQARNQKARDHLLNEEGGVAISRNPLDKGALYDSYKLTARDLYKIQSSLDAREKNMVKEIENYMKELGVYIDEVSEVMLGRKIATESNYMRMKVLRDKNIVVDDATQAMNRNKEGNFIIAPSSKISKTRTGSGKGALIIGGFDKVTLTYARDAIDYITMEKPVNEAKKLLNTFENGIKEVKGGSKIYKKINKFVTDMRGTAYDEQEADKLLKAILSSSREAIMMLNISMTLAQPMSYVLASYYVDGKYLLQGLGKTFSRETIIKMKKYSAVARDRIENKTFNFEMATINDKAPELLDAKTPLKVLRGGLMKPIAAADIKTVALIWESIERKVRSESPKMSEEDVMKTTALVWEEVIKTTQPSTHRSARSEIGRSANVGWKLATLFTGVRNKTFNLLDQSFNKFFRSKRTKKDYAKLAGIVVAIGVLVSFINANRQALVRWLFRKQKTTPKQFIQDMVLTNLGNMYFLGDFAASFRSKTESSIYAGWDYTMLPLQMVNTAISSAVILEDLINAEADEVYTSGKYAGELKRKVLAERALKTITPLVDTVARLPISNVTRLSDAYKNWMEIKPTDEVMSGGTPARSITPRITAPRPAPRPRPTPRPTPRPGR